MIFGAQVLGHAYQDRIVRCLRDCKVQCRVGKPRRVAVGGIEYRPEPLPALRRCRPSCAVTAAVRAIIGSTSLRASKMCSNSLQCATSLAAHMIGRFRPPVGKHEISAVPPVPDFQVASVGELPKCVADRCAGYAKHGGKFALGRQLLTIDIDAKAKSRDEPIHDVVGDITRRDRSPQGRRYGADGLLRRASRSSSCRRFVAAEADQKEARQRTCGVDDALQLN